MFGCVIDNYGYTDAFVQQGSDFTLAVPPISEMNHISLFCYRAETLANIAFQISIFNGPEELKIGFLTDFQPSVTFNSPRMPAQGPAVLKLTLCNYDDVFVQTEHMITPEEQGMVDLQARRMVDNLSFSLASKSVEYGGDVFLPLSALKKWKEQYIEYLHSTK